MPQSIEAQFITWYFFDQPKSILKSWKNLLRFNLNYFSITLLFKTLFSPWHRYRMSYGRGFDLKRYLEAFTFNAISRGLGASVRIIVIIIGVLMEVFIFLGGLIVLLGWLILPFLLLLGLWFGFKSII